MNEIHQTQAPDLTDLKEAFRKRNIEPVREMLDEEAGERLMQVFERIPDSKGFIHGDLHFGNLFMENDELMMTDLESAGFGDSIWELIGLYSTFVVFQMINTEDVVQLGGTDQYAFIWERIMDFWCELTGADREETQRIITILARARVFSFSKRRGFAPETVQMMKRSLCEALECVA